MTGSFERAANGGSDVSLTCWLSLHVSRKPYLQEIALRMHARGFSCLQNRRAPTGQPLVISESFSHLESGLTGVAIVHVTGVWRCCRLMPQLRMLHDQANGIGKPGIATDPPRGVALSLHLRNCIVACASSVEHRAVHSCIRYYNQLCYTLKSSSALSSTVSSGEPY
jgi:hypothetical protein